MVSATLSGLYALAKSLPKDSSVQGSFFTLLAEAIRREASEGDLQSVTMEAGQRFTVDLTDRYALDLFHGIDWEAQEYALFQSFLSPGMVVWDIGANFGRYAVSAAKRVAPGGRVVAFEPNPHAYALLTRNIDDNGVAASVAAIPKAVAASTGQVAFFVTRDSAFSGLSKTDRAPVQEEITIETDTIDAVWEAQGRQPIDALKIDVEGHEAEVLEGAMNALTHSPDIVILLEVTQKNLDSERCARLKSVLERLSGDGFVGVLIGGTSDIPRFSMLAAFAQGLDRVSGSLFLFRSGSRREPSIRTALPEILSTGGAPPAALPDECLRGIEALVQFGIGLNGEVSGLRRDKKNLEDSCRRLEAKIAEKQGGIRAFEERFRKKEGELQAARSRGDELDALCRRLEHERAAARARGDELETLCRRLKEKLQLARAREGELEVLCKRYKR